MSVPPTLAACTAVDNDERYLPHALESVVTQSRPPDEYVIVDLGDLSCYDATTSAQAFATPAKGGAEECR